MYTIVFRTHYISFSRVFLTYLRNYNFSVELFNNMEEVWGLPLFPFPSKTFTSHYFWRTLSPMLYWLLLTTFIAALVSNPFHHLYTRPCSAGLWIGLRILHLSGFNPDYVLNSFESFWKILMLGSMESEPLGVGHRHLLCFLKLPRWY